ncbi:zinc finger protein 91-like [Crotalus adamanteus]|uniref:Zinc finger protein 91-like n=1 Tax=Crotalus adamanteus TaxID=8729 RepID=A0AAW1BUF3_CROAD
MATPGSGTAAPPATLQAGSGGGGGPRCLPEGLRDSEAERRRFRSCRPREGEGPRALCSRLHRLCRGWLRPERSGKAEMLDRVVLEQLLALLPPELAGWLRECGAESCAQAVALAEGFLLGPPPSSAPREPPGEGRQELFTGEISTELHERGKQCNPSPGLLLQRIQLGPLQQGSDPFEEVTVNFTEEEWALLDSGQRALCKEVTLEAFRNIAALGDAMEEKQEGGGDGLEGASAVASGPRSPTVAGPAGGGGGGSRNERRIGGGSPLFGSPFGFSPAGPREDFALFEAQRWKGRRGEPNRPIRTASGKDRTAVTESGLGGSFPRLGRAEAGGRMEAPGAGAAVVPAALQAGNGGGRESGGSGSGPRGLPEGPRNSETERRRFRSCRPREDEGPRALCSRLHRLCRGWLRPEWGGKAEMLDRVVLEQLLALLPSELAGWLRECGAESCAQAVALAEGFLLGPPPSSAPREPPGEGRQVQESFARDISAELQERGEQSSPSQPLHFRMNQFEPPCQANGSATFEEVAVDFTEEEWALLDSGQRALCREVMLDVSRNMFTLGDKPENDNEKQLRPMQTANLQEEMIFDHQWDEKPLEQSHSEDGEESYTCLPIKIHRFLIQQDQKGKRKGKYSKRKKNEFHLEPSMYHPAHPSKGIPGERNLSCPEAAIKSTLLISAQLNHHRTHHSQPLIALLRSRISCHSGPNVLSSAELGPPFSVQPERGMRRGPVPALLKQRTGKTIIARGGKSFGGNNLKLLVSTEEAELRPFSPP